jgi:glycosyltransferase involved in cell wall biosynthesis
MAWRPRAPGRGVERPSEASPATRHMQTATVKLGSSKGIGQAAAMLASRPSMAKPDPKALFVSYSALLGGAERILLDCATGLDSANVACPEGPLARAAREAGLAVETLSAGRLEFRRRLKDRFAAPLGIAVQARELRAAVRELRPAVVFGWSMRGLLVSVGALRGLGPVPALVFQHNDFLPGPAVARAIRAAARRSERVVCLSRAVADDLDPHGRLADRMQVIHPGVDLERFSPPREPPDGAEALVLGWIVGWKRPDLALEAAARAAPDVPGLQLRLAGAPLDASGQRLFLELRRRAARADLDSLVHIEGPLGDPVDALRRAGSLLHCAEREPFGLALVEALACGAPVIAPDAAGPREIVDESCGVLYTPGDAAAAADALRDVLSSAKRRAELSAGARARAERLFDRERSRCAYRELVTELGR